MVLLCCLQFLMNMPHWLTSAVKVLIAATLFLFNFRLTKNFVVAVSLILLLRFGNGLFKKNTNFVFAVP